jgi:hypothetical protein
VIAAPPLLLFFRPQEAAGYASQECGTCKLDSEQGPWGDRL